MQASPCQIDSSKITTLIRRAQRSYCLVCFTFCQNSRFTEGDNIRTGITAAEREEMSCQCADHLSKEVLLTKVKAFVENTQRKPKDKAAQLQYIRDSALLQEIYRINLAESLLSTADDLISQDKKRFVSLQGTEFNWNTMKLTEIDARAELINFLRLSSNTLVRLKHPYSKYAKSILERSFNQVDSPNYDAVVAYQTSCMKLLAHTSFLNEVKYGLEKLDYQTLGSVNMIARVRIRERNVSRLARSEGANERREWLESILRWADNFILDENKVWIRHYKGEVHQAYMYPIRFLRDMIVYGLVNTEQELASIMSMLYNKVPKLKAIETNFINSLDNPSEEDKRYAASNPKYVETVLADLRDIRGYYIEIVYHLFFLQIDFQVVDLMKTGRDKLESLRMFEQDFSRKILEIYMGYVLRPMKWKDYDLIYGKGDGELSKISYLVRKFIQMINNTDDEYLQSLWLTKAKDVRHYLRVSSSHQHYEEQDQMPRLKALSVAMQGIIDDYFVHNKGLYEEQNVVEAMSGIVDGVIDCLNIRQSLALMRDERLSRRPHMNRQDIYKEQLQLLESNMLSNLQTILVLFLKAGVRREAIDLKNRIFDVLKFGYYRNSVCISSFIQKTSLNKLEDVFPEDLFSLLDFSFYNNWIAFTSKGLLTFTKNIWAQTIQKLFKSFQSPNSKEQEQIYATLNSILLFVQKWSVSDEESVLKYLSSSSLEIINDLLFTVDPQKGRMDVLTVLSQNKVFEQLFATLDTAPPEFPMLYLETVLTFVEKRYEWEPFERLKMFFPLKMIKDNLKMPRRVRLILMSALEFLYIDVKNNLLEHRTRLRPIQNPLKPTIYAEPYLMDEDYVSIISILRDQLNELIRDLKQQGGSSTVDPDYVRTGILSPVLRLTAYLSMTPEDEGSQLETYKNDIGDLKEKLIQVWGMEDKVSTALGVMYMDFEDSESSKSMNIMPKNDENSTPDNNKQRSDQDSGHKLIAGEMQLPEMHNGGTGTIHPDFNPRPRNRLVKKLEEIRATMEKKNDSDRPKVELPTICYVLWQFTAKLSEDQDTFLKYNCFLENQDDPRRILLQSKVQRQHLYSNKMDIRRREKDSSLLKFRQTSTMRRHSRDDLLTRIQIAYSNSKTSLTSTEAIDNFYLKRMLSTKPEDQELIVNLCTYIVMELSKPISFKDRNPFYNIMQCVCNILFVATSNVQKVLYEISTKGKDGKDMEEKDGKKHLAPIQWIKNLWIYMLQSCLFVRYKIHEDSVWMDEYMRFWLIVKLFHFLVEMNSQEWKDHFVYSTFEEQEVSNRMLQRRESYLQGFDSNQASSSKHKGMILGLVSLVEQMSHEQNWHIPSAEKGALQKFPYNVREQLFDPAILVIDLLNEIYSGPHEDAQLGGFKYLVDEVNGILNRYVKDHCSKFYVLKQKCVELLRSVTEGDNSEVRRFVLENYPISMLNNVFVNSLRQLYCEFTSKQQGKKHPATSIEEYRLKKDDQESLFTNYIVEPENFGNNALLNISYELYNFFSNMSKQSIKYLNFFKDKVKKANLNSTADNETMSYHFLSRVAMRIQVRTQQGDEELCFKVPGKFVFLSSETRQEFESEVDRSSGAAKINALMSEYKYFKMEMDHYQKHFRQRYWIFKYIVEKLSFAEVFVYILCLALNFSLIANLGTENGRTSDSLSFYSVYIGLGYSIAIISFLAWLIWVVSRLGFSYEIGIDRLNDTLPEDEEVTGFQKFVILLKILLADPESLVFLYHILMVFLGMYVNVCFFALELLIIVNRIATLNYIVKSVYLHWDQLLLTFLLEFLIIYVYGFISYVSYQGRFLVNGSLLTDGTTVTQPYCSNLVHCWMNFMNEGITSGNGIGVLMGTESYDQDNLRFFYARFFVDVTFYLIVNVVMINIIQGIIVDTFSELRENSEAYEKDRFWVCFICNQKYEEFVSRGKSFYEHIEKEHNLWKYVYFLVYLDEKNEKDCDGLESTLKTKVRDEDSSWIPTESEKDAVTEAVEKDQLRQKGLLKIKLNEIITNFRESCNLDKK